MISHQRPLSFGLLQPVRFPNLERLPHNLHACWNLRGFWNNYPSSSVRWSRVGARTILKILARLALIIHFGHSWPISRCSLLLWLLWLAHEPLEDSSNGLLSHLVLLKDLGLSHGRIPQRANPQALVLVVFDVHIDVLCHLLRHSTAVCDVLLMVLENLRNLLEILLVGFGFLDQLVD